MIKGSITPIDPEGDPIPFQFNPSDYEWSRESSWAEISIPGLDFPLQQYVKGGLKTLPLELYLNVDNYDREVSVERYILLLEALSIRTKQTKAPPICRFHYGNFDFICVVGSFSASYTMFDGDGRVREGTVRLELREYQEVVRMFPKPKEEELRFFREAPTYSGDDASGSFFDRPETGKLAKARATAEKNAVKAHETEDGDTFASISTKHYGDPSLWRSIEYANRGRRSWDSLSDIRSGNRFVVPDIENALGLTEDLTGFPPALRESFRTARGRVPQVAAISRIIK